MSGYTPEGQDRRLRLTLISIAAIILLVSLLFRS